VQNLKITHYVTRFAHILDILTENWMFYEFCGFCDRRVVQDFKIFLLSKDLRLSDKMAGLTHKSFLMGEWARDTRGKNDAKIEKMRTLAPCMHIKLRGHRGDTAKVYICS